MFRRSPRGNLVCMERRAQSMWYSKNLQSLFEHLQIVKHRKTRAAPPSLRQQRSAGPFLPYSAVLLRFFRAHCRVRLAPQEGLELRRTLCASLRNTWRTNLLSSPRQSTSRAPRRPLSWRTLCAGLRNTWRSMAYARYQRFSWILFSALGASATQIGHRRDALEKSGAHHWPPPFA